MLALKLKESVWIKTRIATERTRKTFGINSNWEYSEAKRDARWLTAYLDTVKYHIG